MKKILALLAFALLLLAALPADAQFGYGSTMSRSYADYLAFLRYQKALGNGDNMTRYWKSESNIGLAFAGPVKYTLTHNFGRDHDWKKIPDSTLSGNAIPSLGVYVQSNVHYMLKKLSDRSLISLSIGTELSLYRWKINGFKGNTYEVERKSAGMFTVGIPVTLDYKSGCDVDFEPGGTCWAVGAGVIPQVQLPMYGTMEITNGFVKYLPYAYATFGKYVGACVKLRVAVIPWQLSFKTTEKMDTFGPGTETVDTKATGMFMVGLSIMGHSTDWDQGSGERRGWFSGGQRRRASRGGRGINGRLF